MSLTFTSVIKVYIIYGNMFLVELKFWNIVTGKNIKQLDKGGETINNKKTNRTDA